jgi:peptidoglycan/LPS O-acetylase OafA/YrhL
MNPIKAAVLNFGNSMNPKKAAFLQIVIALVFIAAMFVFSDEMARNWPIHIALWFIPISLLAGIAGRNKKLESEEKEMPFRSIVAIVVSLFVVLAVVLVFVVVEGIGEGRNDRLTDHIPPSTVVLVALFLFLLIVGATLLFVYGIRGRKIQPQDKANKEDITRLETSNRLDRLEKKVDEIHEYMVDMYIKRDDKL